MDELLFYEGDMHAGLDAAKRRAKACCESLSPAHVNGASDEELAQHIVSQFRIEPLTIYRDRAYAKHRESKVDVSQHFNRAVFDRSQPCMTKANEITVHIPFSGDPTLFRIRPTTHSLNPPRGTVCANSDMGGEVRIRNTQPMDQGVDEFNRWMKQAVDSIEQSVARSANDVNRFNAQLANEASSWIAKRREQLRTQGELLDRLEIPLRRDSSAPEPLPMPKAVIKPLPNPRAVEQEYTISQEDYEYVLNVIRHQTRSFEQAPSAFLKLNEEELRDVVLASLNSHFKGDAAGERFRKKGKTDICIEHANRAAFVGECKVWSGPEAMAAAVDQLMGYLTWRDCRSSLVLFNKDVRGFAELQGSIPDRLENHSLFIRHESSGHEGEWRAVFRAANDDGREVTIHVFLVDMLCSSE